MLLISIVNNSAVQAFAAHSFHCTNGSMQDNGHTLSSDPPWVLSTRVELGI
jgi:hypothetical protein